jgi:hypothetical protein
MNIQPHNPGADIQQMVTLWAWENRGHERGDAPRALKLFDARRRSTAQVREQQRTKYPLGQQLANWGRSLLHLVATPAEKAGR